MKKKYSNTSNYLLKYSTPFQKLFLLVGKLIILVIFLLFTAALYAQEPSSDTMTYIERSQKIMQVNQYVASLRSDSKNNNSDPLRVEKLINDIQPSIYVSLIDVKTDGENPTCLFTDVKSLSIVSFSDLSSNNIEIVTIRIDDITDLYSIIDLSIFSKFPKLKYIYILSAVKSTKDDILAIVKNNNPRYNVFYNILKTS